MERQRYIDLITLHHNYHFTIEYDAKQDFQLMQSLETYTYIMRKIGGDKSLTSKCLH